MSFTRYAKVEVQEILEVKGSPHQIKTASLTHMGGYEDYRTQDGFLYARIRAISSRVNKNHDAWPSVELAGDHSLISDSRVTSGTGFTVEANQDNRYGFSSFLGKPIFVDHNNTNPKRARGVIVDARLHVEPGTDDPYYKTADCHSSFKPATWVELLLEIDAKTFPRLAKAIIDGSKNPHQGIDGFSMGANVERSICSHCANVATAPDEFCKHIAAKGAYWDYKDPETGQKTSKRSFEFCEGVQFFEISAVFDPADETALIREVRASVEKEADEREAAVIQVPCPHCGSAAEMSTQSGYTACRNCGYTNQQGAAPQIGGDGAMSPGHITPDQTTMGPVDNGAWGPPHQGGMQKGAPDAGDDQYFGGKPGASREAFDNMVKKYGAEKAEEVYYATRNKHKGKGRTAAGMEDFTGEGNPYDAYTERRQDRPDISCPNCGKGDGVGFYGPVGGGDRSNAHCRRCGHSFNIGTDMPAGQTMDMTDYTDPRGLPAYGDPDQPQVPQNLGPVHQGSEN